jgi:hypothetical protein
MSRKANKMNPWQIIRRELDGVIRSVRYDMSSAGQRKRMTQDTQELPVIAPGAGMPSAGRGVPGGAKAPVARNASAGSKRTVLVAVGSMLAVTAGLSGYHALTNGLDALVGGGGHPSGLPGGQSRPVQPTPDPVTSTTPPAPPAGRPGMPVKIPVRPQPSQPGTVSPSPSISPPVPTPAPTCNCPTPSPTPPPSPSQSPSPSPSVHPTPSFTSSVAAPAATMA